MRFGMVNPFELHSLAIPQIFDSAVLELDNMMTGVGIRTCGIEFNPVEIVSSSSHFSIEQIFFR